MLFRVVCILISLTVPKYCVRIPQYRVWIPIGTTAPVLSIMPHVEACALERVHTGNFQALKAQQDFIASSLLF